MQYVLIRSGNTTHKVVLIDILYPNRYNNYSLIEGLFRQEAAIIGWQKRIIKNKK